MIKHTRLLPVLVAAAVLCPAFTRSGVASSLVVTGDVRTCAVKLHDPGLLWVDGAWHGIGAAGDGNLYLGLCSHALEHSALLVRFSPTSGAFRVLGDMGEVTQTPIGTNGYIPQGKIHTPFFEHDGKLYFGTHVGAVTHDILKQRQTYPGGRFVSYDLLTGAFRVIGLAPEKEGIVTLAPDFARGKLYALTFPSSLLLVYDLRTGLVQNWGPTEATWMQDQNRDPYTDACRYLAVDPATGRAFGSRIDGTVFMFDPVRSQLAPTSLDVSAGVVGSATNTALHTGWRTIRYDPRDQCFYGLHRGTTSLFRFDPRRLEILPVTRLAPTAWLASPDSREASRLGFVLTDDRVIYHVAHGPPLPARGRKNGEYQTYLVRYDLRTRQYRDYGALVAGDQRVIYCDSLAVGANGSLYALAAVEVTDPQKEEQLKARIRGTGSYSGLGGLRFEIVLIEIPSSVLNAPEP